MYGAFPRPLISQALTRPVRVPSSHFAAILVPVQNARHKHKDHVLEKSHDLDPQAEAVQRTKQAKEKGEGGSATEQKDTQNATEKAKRDHPEARDVIGMQDERGSKGS